MTKPAHNSQPTTVVHIYVHFCLKAKQTNHTSIASTPQKAISVLEHFLPKKRVKIESGIACSQNEANPRAATWSASDDLNLRPTHIGPRPLNCCPYAQYYKKLKWADVGVPQIYSVVVVWWVGHILVGGKISWAAGDQSASSILYIFRRYTHM